MQLCFALRRPDVLPKANKSQAAARQAASMSEADFERGVEWTSGYTGHVPRLRDTFAKRNVVAAQLLKGSDGALGSPESRPTSPDSPQRPMTQGSSRSGIFTGEVPRVEDVCGGQRRLVASPFLQYPGNGFCGTVLPTRRIDRVSRYVCVLLFALKQTMLLRVWRSYRYCAICCECGIAALWMRSQQVYEQGTRVSLSSYYATCEANNYRVSHIQSGFAGNLFVCERVLSVFSRPLLHCFICNGKRRRHEGSTVRERGK